MTAIDLFNLGNKYQQEGKVDLAIQMWTEAIQADKYFSLPLVNMHNTFRAMNNLSKAKECLLEFLRRPVTGETIDMIPKIREELTAIEQQMNPKPPDKK